MIQRFQKIVCFDCKTWHCELMQIAIMSAIMGILALGILDAVYGDTISSTISNKSPLTYRNEIDPGLFEFKRQGAGQCVAGERE